MPSQVPNDGSVEVQSRFSYLLKPIRDLFKNWEIDIAAELEEYLHDVSKPRKVVYQENYAGKIREDKTHEAITRQVKILSSSQTT